MTFYTVNIYVAPSRVKGFNEGGFKLCFATAVNSGAKDRYNVVAHASGQFRPSILMAYPFQTCLTMREPGTAPHITFRWEEKYQIAASMDKFADGGM